MFSIGPVKGKIVDAVVKARAPTRVVEVGFRARRSGTI